LSSVFSLSDYADGSLTVPRTGRSKGTADV